MWFYPILLALALLAIVGAIFLGGVFTLVLVPLFVVALVSTLGYAIWARSQTSASGGENRPAGDRPLPHRHSRPASSVTASPEQLVDGRRQHQQVPEP